ncbi:protein of unknown function [Thiohalospira halophila DSM 15071]|uniref:DUF4224 domain-containing protein n=1 Tax=Thiohalospira halophila DSM 15071 TaxID=1123397 RepID=A0A1I1UF96_9GAMM|nr:DUF4224 domain-containing protein [Thiohalospira halophila]SFD66630.1 protein of unknown function [Thiohalospira halophila DSM 15071]
MSLCLTADELQELTGYQLPAYQRGWLERNGWTYVEDRVGRPRVSRAHAEQMLAGGSGSSARPEPDFARLRKTG